MSIKRKINKSGFLHRQLFLVIFVALFFSLSMTWVELDPVIDHQKNVEILRSDPLEIYGNENLPNNSTELVVSEKRVRHTDGIVFGSSILLVIIVGGVLANIRKL